MTPPGVLHFMEMVVGRWSESISPGKDIYQDSDQLHGFTTNFSLAHSVLSHQGAWPELPVITLLLLIKILARTICESICNINNINTCFNWGLLLLPGLHVLSPHLPFHPHIHRGEAETRMNSILALSSQH